MGDNPSRVDTVATDFIRFLEEYGIIGLAIAVVIGTATKDLVNAIVNDIIMPIIGIVLPGGTWETATIMIGAATFPIGHLLSALLDFIIIALLIYLFVRYIIRQEDVEKIT